MTSVLMGFSAGIETLFGHEQLEREAKRPKSSREEASISQSLSFHPVANGNNIGFGGLVAPFSPFWWDLGRS